MNTSSAILYPNRVVCQSTLQSASGLLYECSRSFGVPHLPKRTEPASLAHTKLIDDIADQIYEKIVAGEYAPGSQLKQELLARHFAVSRTPIREALSRLEAKGIIRQAQRRSAVVHVPSAREIVEIYQVRAELEGLATQLAVKWISDQQLAQLRILHDDFVRAVRSLKVTPGTSSGRKTAHDQKRWEKASERWAEVNEIFHKTICDSSKNRYLAKLIQELSAGYARNILISSARKMSRFRVDANIKWHEKVLKALEERDPDAARLAMTQHILEASEIVSALFHEAAG